MPSGIQVVQRIENDVKALEPIYVELRILDVGMVRFKLDMAIEFLSALFCDLCQSLNEIVASVLYGDPPELLIS